MRDKTKSPPDAELAAMRRILAILSGFDKNSAYRIARYCLERTSPPDLWDDDSEYDEDFEKAVKADDRPKTAGGD